jgi:hypothetical protein
MMMVSFVSTPPIGVMFASSAASAECKHAYH